MKFSIGLPITKTKYLKDSLDSIDAQTFKDFEVVIRNNAKTPELKSEIKEICKDWINRANVTYTESAEQVSMTQNFNKIIENVRGEYCLIMSDDDIMEPAYLEEFNNLIEKYPSVNVFHCRVMRIDGNNQLIDFSENCPELENQLDFIYHRMTSRRALYLSDFVAKTSALKNIGGFPVESSGWGCDEITWMRLADNGVAFTQKVLLKYRRFLGNFSMSKENLLLRFKDVNFVKETTEQIIESSFKNSKPVYPYQYLIDLNNIKTQKQKDFIIEHYAKSSNLMETLTFFTQNKKELTYKGLFKSLVLKTFYKKKTYPIT